MDRERQISKLLIEDDLSWPEWLNGVAVAKQLRDLDIPTDQLPISVEVANELKDPDFRAAAIDMLGLRKRTGKSLGELEVYIKELGTRGATLEKNNTAKEELESSLKQNIKQCRQQREEEEDKLKKEKARNRHILDEDTEKLEQQLVQNNQTRENVAQTVTLASKLGGIGLSLPTFVSIVGEIAKNKAIDLTLGKKISKHIAEYGSLIEAKKRAKADLESINAEIESKKQSVAALSQKESRERKVIATLGVEIAEGNEKANKLMEDIKANRNTIKSQEAYFERNRWQYCFFETFVNMLLKSPSAPKSAEDLGFATSSAAPLAALGRMIQALDERGWGQSAEGTPEKRRVAFILAVMGTYLRSIHCGHCGASFIVNKACNAFDHWRSSYNCPVCDRSSYTKPDDTFFSLMASPELAKKFGATQDFIDNMGKMDIEALEKVYGAILEMGEVEAHGTD